MSPRCGQDSRQRCGTRCSSDSTGSKSTVAHSGICRSHTRINGAKAYGRGHEAVPLAQAAADRSSRVSGVDGRKSSAPFEVPEVTTALIGGAIETRRFASGRRQRICHVSGSSLAALSDIRFILIYFSLFELTASAFVVSELSTEV